MHQGIRNVSMPHKCSPVLSTAEAISVLANSMALAGSFGSGEVTAHDLAAGLQGSVVKDEEKDRITWQEYLTNVLKKRGAEWRPLSTRPARSITRELADQRLRRAAPLADGGMGSFLTI